MRQMITYFIKYPVLGNVFIFAMVLFGLFGYMNLTTTFFPTVPSRNITIQAVYPGASPQEIEEAIVLKIEDNLKGVTGIDRSTSVSSENVGQINIEILTGSDIDVVLQDVKNAVGKINSFPIGMEPVLVYKQEPREFGINFGINGDVELKVLKSYARKVERDLLSVDGISKISLSGFPDEEIEISFREADLLAYGLTFTEVANAVKKGNITVTGGKIKGDKEELLVRADVKGYYAEEINNLVVKSSAGGTIIRLKDVADVKDRWAENPNRFYFNGKPSVQVTVQTTNNEDLFYVTDYVKEYIKEFNEKNSVVSADILRDGSDIIQQRKDILSSNGIIGIFLVVLLLSLFLNYRLSFWVALSIPLSFLGMFALALIYGMTINVMSLLAMILVIGILVDDGIVIAENIYQHYEKGKTPLQAAVDGTMEVLPSVISAVLTTIVAFMTFMFLEGAMGDRAGDIGFVVMATLIISLVEGIFILPAHIAHSKALHTKPEKEFLLVRKMEEYLFRFRDKFYGPILKFVIKHTAVAIAVPIAAFIITIGALKGSIIKTTFFPVLEFDRVDVTLEMAPGTRDYIIDSILVSMEKKVWQLNEEMKNERTDGLDVIKSVGRSVGPGTHQGSLSLTLLEGETRNVSSMEMTARVREKIGNIDQAQKLSYGQRTHWGMPVSISLVGGNLDDIRAAKVELKNELRKMSSLKDVIDNDPPGLREVNIRLKEKAFALGLTTKDVMDQVRQGFFGGEAQRILRGIDEVKIWVRYEEPGRRTISQLEDMRVKFPGGIEYPLSEIATLSVEPGIMSINHINGQREITVEADIANSSISVTDILDDVRANIITGLHSKYPDIKFDYEGQQRESGKTMKAMMKVLPPVLIIMFIIVVFTFKSFMQAIIVFVMIPFSLVGVAWGHFIQGYILSILSLFGIIALAGIIVNDSLVLVGAMNRLLKEGKDFNTALYEAGISRFRPVLLTSLTTIAGLGPLIFEPSFQAQFLSPMAISVAYGLLWGTGLTLLMLPAFLVLANRLKVVWYWLISGKKPSYEEVEHAVREEYEV